MNAEESRTAVLALLSQITPEADLGAIDVDADLRTELDIDSMDFLNLVEGVAESTGVDIPESDYPKVRSVEGLTSYLVSRTATQPRSPVSAGADGEPGSTGAGR